MLGQNLRNGMGKVKLARIGLLAQSFNLFQLLPPQFVDFLVECQRVPCLWRSLPQQVNSDYKQAGEGRRFMSSEL